jgi:ketosteroid isomerase-like protein
MNCGRIMLVKKFIVATCSLGILLCFVAAAAGSQESIDDQLIKLNATLQLATKNYDVSTLTNLITDDYELISSSGKVYDRAAFLADAADRSAIYELNEPEDVAVRHYHGDCAIVTAILHVRYRAGDKTVDTRIRYGDVWVKLDGTWKYAYGEASPLRH